MAEIWMVFGAEEYKYGTYRFVTRAEKNRVNDLAMQIREERGCETYVKEIGEYGYCPLYVKQSLEDEYKQYHTLKGNGVGTQIYHALMELPTEPPHEGED